MYSSLPTLVALSWSLLPLGELTESPRRVEATAVYDGHFLCLYSNGSIQAWNLKTWKSAKDVAAQFARDGLRAIASDRDKLWAVDGKTVYQWAAKDKQWKKLAAYDAEGEWVVSIIPVGGTPYLVFPAKVVDPTREKGGMFPYPAMIDLFCESPLRILATHGSESKVWIGTGNGEWGGTLIGFDPKTGKWVSSRDGGGYVTGITHSEKDEVIVSWSMSHFAASTRIVDHKADATVKTKHPGMFKKYYQCVAYNPHDELLYGIEQRDVVTIKDGKPTKVASLSGRLYERELNAIGVAPGVSHLIPVGSKNLIAIPKRGHPWLIREKEVVRLRTP